MGSEKCTMWVFPQVFKKLVPIYIKSEYTNSINCVPSESQPRLLRISFLGCWLMKPTHSTNRHQKAPLIISPLEEEIKTDKCKQPLGYRILKKRFRVAW